MARHGFAVGSIWRSEHEGKVEFVYLIDWPAAATMKAAWAAFMADPEWAAIKKETGARHGRFVDAISERTLEPLPSSPARAGAGGYARTRKTSSLGYQLGGTSQGPEPGSAAGR